MLSLRQHFASGASTFRRIRPVPKELRRDRTTTMTDTPPTFSTSTAPRSRCAMRAAATPGVVWLGGYRPTCSAPRPRRWPTGRQRKAAPSCATTIPAMASPAAPSPTARSRNGWRESLAVFRRFTKGRRSWSAPRWAPGSRCAWCRNCARPARRSHRRPGAAGAGAGFHRRTDRTGADRGAEARPCGKGLLRGAVRIFRRALHLHARADRGRPQRTG